MRVKGILKKVLQVLIQDHLVVCVLSISIFSLLTPQPSHSQEANKIAETSSHLQQQSTLIKNRNEQLASDFQPPASTRGMRKIAKKEV